MSVHAAARKHLLDYPGMQTKVGQRIYWLRLPDNATYPAISFFRVSNPCDHLINRFTPRFQFDAWSLDPEEATEIAGMIRKAFQRFKGTMGGAGGTPIKQGVYDNMLEMYEPDTKLYHVLVDVFFIYLEN